MKTLFIILLFIAIIINGCTVPAYVTNTPHVPLFKKSNELNAEFIYGLTGNEIKLSYALSDNLFAFGGATFWQHDSITVFKRKIIEGGIGYYDYMEEPFVIPFLLKINHFEALAGYGSGSSYGNFTGIVDSFSVKVPADYRRIFLQINLGLSHSTYLERLHITVNAEYGHAIRLSFIDFYKFNYENLIINKHLNNLFFEYLGFSRLGIGVLKLELYAGIIVPVHKNSEFDGLFFFLGLGASLNFSL